MKKVLSLLRKIVLLVLLLLLLVILYHWEFVGYGSRQLYGQLRIIWKTEKVEQVLERENLPDSVRNKLLLIEEVRRFASDSLGLKNTASYTRFYDQQGQPVLKVLTASEAFALKAYEWDFPFLGKVSYKGFFDFEEGRKEEEHLSKRGYDTDYGEVSAWSTLGWFKDPILSGMLRRSEGQLAELIIHEMTHATLYLKNNVALNENLASAIGELGTIRFLESKGEQGKRLLEKYIQQEEDYHLYSTALISATHSLEAFYDSIRTFDPAQKIELKEKKFYEIEQELLQISFLDTARYRSVIRSSRLNNAYLLGFVRYDARKEEMKKEIADNYQGNIGAYLVAIKARYEN